MKWSPRQLGRRQSMRLAVLVTAGLALAACEPQGNKPLAAAPRAKVNLPPSPPLVEPEVVHRTANGALTVAGALASASGTMGKATRVEGSVAEVHDCLDADGAMIPKCSPPPHLVLVDDMDPDSPRLVVSGAPEQITAFSEGRRTTVTGRIQQWSTDKTIVRSEGLLQLPEPPPPAPAAPRTPSPPTVDGTPPTGKKSEK